MSAQIAEPISQPGMLEAVTSPEGIANRSNALVSRQQPSATDMLEQIIKTKLQPNLPKDVQHEIAELIDLLPDLEGRADLMSAIEVAVAGLLSDKPNLQLAKAIRENVSRRVRKSLFSFDIFRSRAGASSPAVHVVLGLGVLLYFAIPVWVFAGGKAFGDEKLLGFDSSMIMLVGLSGAVGSIVSIMVRLQDFEKAGIESHLLFFTGLFKPVIGMAFALFVFMVLNAGILPISITPEKANYFYCALAFIAGFSERFASDVMTQTENVVVSKRTD